MPESLKQGDQLLCSFCNVKGALDHLLCHKVLIERLLLRPQNEHPTLSLKVGCRRSQRGETCRHCRVPRLLREEQDHICDCPDYALGARDERVKLLIFGADEKFLDAPRDRFSPPHNLLL